MCVNKDKGGMDFKDFADFNTAIFGKQLWRLIEKPNTLFSRVFKGRYLICYIFYSVLPINLIFFKNILYALWSLRL